MFYKILLRVGLSLALGFAVQINCFAQSNSPSRVGTPKHKVVGVGTYERVLDMLFPRDEVAASVLILRFEPNFAPESQITIRKVSNKLEVIEYTSLSGNIYKKLNDFISHGGKEDEVAEMAKLILVKKRLIEVSDAHAKQWYLGFFDAMSESIRTFKKKNDDLNRKSLVVALDGTTYVLWYEDNFNKITLSLYDQALEDSRLLADFKIVQWMNSISREVRGLN